MPRRTPASTLFPYTTLFRSLRHTHTSHLLADGVPLPVVSARLGHSSVRVTAEIYSHMIHGQDDEAHHRSEEHTSELQSRLHLVCRLLLEKKKTTPDTDSTTTNPTIRYLSTLSLTANLLHASPTLTFACRSRLQHCAVTPRATPAAATPLH